MCFYLMYYLFFFNDTATTEIYTLSLHDALPILNREAHGNDQRRDQHRHPTAFAEFLDDGHGENSGGKREADRREDQPVQPAAIPGPRAPPVDAQADERERERQEHVDRIEHDQQIDAAAAPEQDH